MEGVLPVFGSKNATLPILAATILTDQPCVLENIPRIHDVMIMLEIITKLGAEVVWIDEKSVRITAQHIDPEKLDQGLVRKVRGSILLMGSLLARFKTLRMSFPGGCSIGARPIEVHLQGLEDLGVRIERSEKEYLLSVGEFRGGNIVLSEFSVTGTETLMVFASLFSKTTAISIAAAEPHVTELATFLEKMGVAVMGEGTHTLELRGAPALRGVTHTMWPDPIEAGTFLTLAALRGNCAVTNVPIQFLDIVLKKMSLMGVDIAVEDRARTLDAMYDTATVRMKSRPELKPITIQTMPYPGFPTDLQPIFCVLATQAHGATLVRENIYEGRFRYVDELKKMGANASIIDQHQVMFHGPTVFYGTEVISHDLRCGATLLLASILAEGKSTISNVEQIDRGYEAIEERLRNVGVDIKRTSK